MSFDPAGDHGYFDGLEAVTYGRRGTRSVGDDGVVSESGSATVDVEEALRSKVKTEDLERSGGVVQLSDVAWSIAVADLGDAPDQEDTITDAGGVVYRVV